MTYNQHQTEKEMLHKSCFKKKRKGHDYQLKEGFSLANCFQAIANIWVYKQTQETFVCTQKKKIKILMTNNKTQRGLWIIQTKAFLPLLSPCKPSKKKRKARLFFFLIFLLNFFQSFSLQNPWKLTRKTNQAPFFSLFY